MALPALAVLSVTRALKHCSGKLGFSFLDFVSGLAGFAKTEALGFTEQAFATNQHRGIECDVVVS